MIVAFYCTYMYEPYINIDCNIWIHEYYYYLFPTSLLKVEPSTIIDTTRIAGQVLTRAGP